MQNNPRNTPLDRYIAKLMKQGMTNSQATFEAFKNKWPHTRDIGCIIYSRAHRSAFIALVHELIKRGIAIDYEYRGKKEMYEESGDSTSEARGTITIGDRTTPLPEDLLDALAEKYDIRWDCYDDEFIPPIENPKMVEGTSKLKAKLLS